MKSGFLILAGRPELIGRFRAPSAAPADGPTPLARVSFKACRDFLKARRELLALALAEKEQISSAEATERLDGIVTALDFVDRLEVRYRAGAGHAVVSFTLQTAQPLKK